MGVDNKTNEIAAKKMIWLWLPSLYFVKGLFYAIITMLLLTVLKHMGLSNGMVTAYVACMFVGWLLKPLWRPVVDTLFTRKFWVVITEFLAAMSLYFVSLSLAGNEWIDGLLLWFLLFSVVASTHDVAVDNYYIERLTRYSSTRFDIAKGLSACVALLLVGGIMLMVGGNMEVITRQVGNSWSFVFNILSIFILSVCIYHCFVLRRSNYDVAIVYKFSYGKFRRMFIRRVVALARKKHSFVSLIIIFLYPVGFGLLWNVLLLFLIDRTSYGGLGLSPQEFGFVAGTIGVMALACGGFCGLMLLRRSNKPLVMWLMTFALLLTPIIPLYLSIKIPDNLLTTSVCIAIFFLLTGFGCNAYFSFISRFSSGNHSAAHKGMCFSIATLSLMVTGMVAGYWQEMSGYHNFFIYAAMFGLLMLCLPPLASSKKVW